MDVLADTLARARARGALFSCLALGAPWGAAFGGTRPLTAHAMLTGSGWLESDDLAEAIHLEAGDLVLGRAGAPYRIVHAPDAPATPISDLRAAPSPAPTDGAAAAAQLMCGAYHLEGSVCDGLLAALPRFVVVRAVDREPALTAAIALLQTEIAGRAPGRQTVMDHLLDLVLVYALREWFANPDHRPPGWYAALDDPELGAILSALHTDPSRSWTVDTMAATVGLSRAAFAKRFTAVVGQSPARYLLRLRMELAEAALMRPRTTLASVASEVGYGNEFAFSDAFKRTHGVTPGRWRDARAGSAV